jgi:hypothetical protein
MKISYFLFLILFPFVSFSQTQKQRPVNILFIGNSYTYVNSLPQILVGVSASAGEIVSTDSYTVGSYTLEKHFNDSLAIRKIRKGDWDYVVLQEYSQGPSAPIEEVEKKVFPYARKLDSLIHRYSPNARTLFYVTWGRKNGDKARCPAWPPVCTYAGMDSLTCLRYKQLAKMNNAGLVPVGQVWKYIREHYSWMELYWPDNSHPTELGSYAGACCFYSVIFGKSPMNIKYNYTLSEDDALKIRKAVEQVTNGPGL